jgi:hypothetical protein
MKNKNILLLATLLFVFNLSWAQKDVKFNINHLLDGSPFAFNTATQNSMGHDFDVSRLEYYISEIEITHDTGKVTKINDFWLLINASQQTLVDLGSLNIDQVEAISFHVGVDEVNNHADPSQYPSTHPLGPKAPSMHWGWAAGYRFVAIEGKSGASLAYDYQLHGLGDNNYFKTTITSPKLTPFANGVVIGLNAEYTGILQGINLSSGVIEHGEYREARQALLNFQNHVFTGEVTNTAIDDELVRQSFQLYPNPTSNGGSTLTLDEVATENFSVVVSDLIGRKILQTELNIGQKEVSIPVYTSGIFVVSLIKEGRLAATQKLVVK